MAVTIEVIFDPQDKFYNAVMNYSHLIGDSNYYAAAQIENGLARIILGNLSNAISESGMPAIYAIHLLQGVEREILGNLVVQEEGQGFRAIVPDIEGLGDSEDLVRGMHYHALAANVATEGRKFSRTLVNRIELPYIGQEMYNENRPERRQAFWEAIANGDATYTVEVKRRSRGRKTSFGSISKMGGYSFEVSIAGKYEETLAARVATWGNRYPEWLLLEYGSSGPPTIQPTHLRSILRQNILSFMESAWETQFNTLLDQWDRSERYAAAAREAEEREWQRYYSRHIGEEIDKRSYSFEPAGRGSKLRGPGGRFV